MLSSIFVSVFLLLSPLRAGVHHGGPLVKVNVMLWGGGGGKEALIGMKIIRLAK